MIGCDIDGTLLNYNSKAITLCNYLLIEQLASKTDELRLITNQGGIGIGFINPSYFVDYRINPLLETLYQYNIKYVSLFVSLYHPKASVIKLPSIAQHLRSKLKTTTLDYATIHITYKARKPNSFLLKKANLSIYYGDSEEDEKAALNGNIQFVKVNRFEG